MQDLCNDTAIVSITIIFQHMLLKDSYEAGLISEDMWKSYLKRSMNMLTKEGNDADKN